VAAVSHSGRRGDADALRITEIFYSLQGEARTVGLPTVFVRLTGCPLRCGYCDTAYAFHGGTSMPLDEIVAQVATHEPAYVTVTGGEPLAQPNCLPLLTQLCDAGYEVSLETSGALSVAAVDPRVVKVLDLKTPGSGEMGRNDWSNIAHLTPRDQVKFVICDREDYEWARFKLDEHALARARVGRAVLAQPRAAGSTRTRRVDSRRPAARASAAATAQAALG
jgi:7-carboxy-7-deazaguanine synthase